MGRRFAATSATGTRPGAGSFSSARATCEPTSPGFGRLAAEEMGNETWAKEDYLYGPLALGIAAAAVNEASEHCEDLFALLTFLRNH
jgi:hypothetical protein